VLEAYERAVTDLRPAGATLAAEIGTPADLALRASRRSVGDLALPDDVYRAFLAFATRPRLRGIFFATLKLAHRTAYFLRHGRLPRPGDDPF
jgi:hypothetical protein